MFFFLNKDFISSPTPAAFARLLELLLRLLQRIQEFSAVAIAQLPHELLVGPKGRRLPWPGVEL